MIATIVLSTCVVGLGVALLTLWLRLGTRLEAMDDAARDTRGIAEKAHRATTRLTAASTVQQDGVPTAR